MKQDLKTESTRDATKVFFHIPKEAFTEIWP